MEAYRAYTTVLKNGEIVITGAPFKKGQKVEMIVLPQDESGEKKFLTGKELAESEFIGIWKDKKIGDSAGFARKLRERAQNRNNQ
ncbi:MAG: hypothetical protein V4642_14345 [Bacteroidota bacterium]